MAREVRVELLAKAKLIEAFGPSLRRPHADTLEGSKHANMKELRFSADGGECARRSRSIQSETPSCLWRVTSPASLRRGSIARSSPRLMPGLMRIWKG